MFFRTENVDDMDENLLGILISAQFDSYRRVAAECPDRKTAEQHMDTLMVYHFDGRIVFFWVCK